MAIETLTIPSPHEINIVRHQYPIHTYNHLEIERYLRQLQSAHPASQLVVSTPAEIIETSCHTGARNLILGHLTILEHVLNSDKTQRFQVDLLGGPTGYESFYLPPSAITIDWAQSGWAAYAGIPGQHHACYVPAHSMMAAGMQFLDRLRSGERLNFPATLTPEERQQRLDDAKRQLLARIRFNTSAKDPASRFNN